MMTNPFLWLLFVVVALVVLFVASAAVAAIVDAIRKPTCEACGHVRGEEIEGFPIQYIHERDLS
jgi:hypothetical protein